MPYHVAKTSQCPAGKPWGVIKDSDGSKMGCHPSKGAANKQMAALYANEPGMKATPDLNTRVVTVPQIRPATNTQRTAANVSNSSQRQTR
jgi:hypothetical protein